MHFALSIGHPDDLVLFNLSAYSTQPCTTLTDVQGGNILREYLAVGIGPKDAHRHFHYFPGLSALPHLDVLWAGYPTGEPGNGARNRSTRPHDWLRINGFRPHGETVANRCRANSNTR